MQKLNRTDTAPPPGFSDGILDVIPLWFTFAAFLHLSAFHFCPDSLSILMLTVVLEMV